MANLQAPLATNTSASRWILWPIAIALLATAWLVDPFALAAFDAPKSLIAITAAVVGASAMPWHANPPEWRRWARPALAILIAALLAAIGLIVAAATSKQPASAGSALSVLGLFALFLPLGASRGLDGPGGRRLLWVGALAVSVNAVLSLLQAAGVALPIPMALPGGRFPTGALLGNEGYVALACALMAAAGLAFALNARQGQHRMWAAALCVLAIAVILVNRQLTSVLALTAALIAILAVRWRARWIVAIGATVVLLAATAALVPALRNLTWAALPVRDVVSYQQHTTYRLGAWAAAIEMIRERPLFGHGPGSYATQSQKYRLAAEIRLQARLTPPPTANGFVYAHQEYLQLAAEAGLITLLAVVAALTTLIAALLRLARSPGSAEPLALLAVIITGAVAALAWFPMQIPFTAVLLLLACGRAWRLIADSERALP